MQNTKNITMRIDLIPEISEVPITERPKTAIVTMKNESQAAAQERGRLATAQNAQRPRSVSEGYSELFHNIYDAAIITDLHGRIRDTNHRAGIAFGYSQAEFSHLTLDRLIQGTDSDLIRTFFENLRRDCFSLLQANCIRKDGSVFPAEISVSEIKLSTPHLCFMVRDETIRRHTDEMLRTEHNALQNSCDAIVVIDMNTRIEYANPATAKIWKYQSPNDLIGQYLGRLFINPNDGRAVIDSLSGENYVSTGDAIARRADDETFRVEIHAACNRNSDGLVTGAVISFSDLTERDRVISAENYAKELQETAKNINELHASSVATASEIKAFLEELMANPAAIADDALRAKLPEIAGSAEGLVSISQDVSEQLSIALKAAPQKISAVSLDFYDDF